MAELCSRGNVKKLCCVPETELVANHREAYGAHWVYYFNDGYVDDRIVQVAHALGLDPHDLDDDVRDRGWEYHDARMELAIAQGAATLLEAKCETEGK